MIVMDGDALIAGEETEYEIYNSKNGLPHMVTPNSRSYVSDDGDAYIVGEKGFRPCIIVRVCNDVGIPFQARGKDVFLIKNKI